MMLSYPSKFLNHLLSTEIPQSSQSYQ